MALISRRARTLAGEGSVPGDKSISHRALIVGSVAVGETRISGLLEADDVLRTVDALRALGARLDRDADGVWHVFGRGVGGLAEPASVLDMGNSGTGARLLMGLLATHPFTSFFCGDASLSARPMDRVMTPLRRMGAAISARSGYRLPLMIRGTAGPLPIVYELPVALAQVKSAVLLAGLNTPGTTSVVEPQPTRDHSERMLRHFGAEVAVGCLGGGGGAIGLRRPAREPRPPGGGRRPANALAVEWARATKVVRSTKTNQDSFSPVCEVRRTHPCSYGGCSTRGGAIRMDYPSRTTIESIC